MRFEITIDKVSIAEKTKIIEELSVNNKILEKQLGLRDESFTKKLLIYDDKFEMISKESDKVLKLSSNVEKLFTQLNNGQILYHKSLDQM